MSAAVNINLTTPQCEHVYCDSTGCGPRQSECNQLTGMLTLPENECNPNALDVDLAKYNECKSTSLDVCIWSYMTIQSKCKDLTRMYATNHRAS